jgi:hypothetical protein
MKKEETNFFDNDWITTKDTNTKTRKIFRVAELPFIIRISKISVSDITKRTYHLSGYRYATENEIKKEKIRRMFDFEKDNKSKYI